MLKWKNKNSIQYTKRKNKLNRLKLSGKRERKKVRTFIGVWFVQLGYRTIQLWHKCFRQNCCPFQRPFPPWPIPTEFSCTVLLPTHTCMQKRFISWIVVISVLSRVAAQNYININMMVDWRLCIKSIYNLVTYTLSLYIFCCCFYS